MTTIIRQLSEEQQEIFECFKNGENLFITGPAGSGKTFLIRTLYEWCNENNKSIQVCALTGCAAVLLQTKAKTIHSWAGIGLANGEIINIIQNVANNIYKKKNWTNTNILIIDEISMMSSKILTILDGIAKKVRKNNRPFGGMQIIFSGDFYQLPPISSKNDTQPMQFCFENPIWDDLFDKEYHLSQIFRQSNKIYTNILNQIREGHLSKQAYTTLQSRLISCPEQLLKPTKLLPRRAQVNIINTNEMNSLNTEQKIYTMTIATTADFTITERQLGILHKIPQQQINWEIEYLKNSIMCDQEIILKIGAQVMCVINIDTESDNPIVNGSCGIIIGFDSNQYPIVQFKNNFIRTMTSHIWESEQIKGIGIKQIPLILSWAISIHHAQGTTLDIAEIDIGNGIFECGQSYVALSRVKELEGLYLTGFNPQKIKVHPKVKEYYQRFN
jgi:ATP-dependent DNA helicase PIF1